MRRWHQTRTICPLCNKNWHWPPGPSLKELCAAKLKYNEQALVYLVSRHLDSRVYKVLDSLGLRYWVDLRGEGDGRFTKAQRRLLGHAFAGYLKLDELEYLVECKKRRIK